MRELLVNINKIDAEEDFDDFLMAMDGQLKWLEEEASELNLALSISKNTPELLEVLFDRMSEGMNDDNKDRLLVIFGRYLGEFVRNTYGGKWTLPLDDEKNINFNTPVIVGHSKFEGLEFSPIRTMRAYSLRKKPGMIRKIIHSDISPKILDLSKEASKEELPDNDREN